MSGKTLYAPLTPNECGRFGNLVGSDHVPAKAPLPDVTISVERLRLIRRNSGAVEACPVGDPLSGRAQTVNLRPTKYGSSAWKQEPSADLLRRLFDLDPEVYLKLPDAAVWEIAAKAATEGGISGNNLRTLSRACLSFCAVRCGLEQPTMYTLD